MTLAEHRITAGFIPLLDSLLLIAAKEKGFAAAEGIDLALAREISWANIRDRVAVGQFDVAHMLAPMPIAASLGLTPMANPVIAPMALGLGGNAVTVSMPLWARLEEAGAPAHLDATQVGQALARVIALGGRKLRFGVVHPHSAHNYELRYWLAASGIHPERDVESVVLPPPLMADALAAGGLDGYCVGEPWNSVGVAAGLGRVATVMAAIWRRSPEKVLGATESWAAHNPEALAALLRALYRASQWCGEPANHAEAAAILAGPAYLNQPVELILRGLSGRIDVAAGQPIEVEDFFLPHAHSATFPWVSHALFFYSQMVRWGDVVHTEEHFRLAGACYRPDLYRAAIAPFGAALPTSDRRPIPAEDFFDGIAFDPMALNAYMAAQAEK